MTAWNQDFSMMEGEAKVVRFTATDDEGDLDLNIAQKLVWSFGEVDKIPGSGLTVTGALSCQATLDRVDTEGKAPRSLSHELWVVDDAGRPSLLSTGTIGLRKGAHLPAA